jgi:hypothetical protein
MLGLLFDIEAAEALAASPDWQYGAVGARLRLAKQDIEQDFPGTDLPYGYFWFGLREGISIANLFHPPFGGTIVKATRKNMVEVGDKAGVSTVACLTEERIVDGLLRDCGALLILEQDTDSHQCRRLRSHNVPYGMLSPDAMAALSDGDVFAVDRGRGIHWSRSHAPDWPQPAKRKAERRPMPKPEPKLQPIPAVDDLMRKTVVPHFEAMVAHIDGPLRVDIIIQADGCKDSEWLAEFKPGSVTVREGVPSGVNVILSADVDAWPKFIQQKLSWNNMMKELTGDTHYFPTLIDAWNAVLDKD